MFNDWEEFEDLDESLQAEFDRDFETEFGTEEYQSRPMSLEEFHKENKRMIEFSRKWRSSHGL